MEPRTYGLIIDDILPEHYVFGAGQIEGEVLQPDRDWRAFVPPAESQLQNGFDPLSCATYGTFNCMESLQIRKYGVSENYSDRFTAQVSGTQFRRGNSPHTVAEFI